MPYQSFSLRGWIRWGCCAAYLGLVTWLSLGHTGVFADLPQAVALMGVDKLLHFFMYGILVLLLRWALADRHLSSLSCWMVVLGAAAYGLAMELCQSWLVPCLRSFEMGDLAANTVGVVSFWWLAAILIGNPTAADKLATTQSGPPPPTPAGSSSQPGTPTPREPVDSNKDQ